MGGCLSDKGTWFKVTWTDNVEPTVMPLDQGPGADALEDEMKAISSGLSDARSHYEITDPVPDDHPGGDHPPGPTPTALAELLQIPTMSSMGVLLLILCLGAMLSRIGRRRS